MDFVAHHHLPLTFGRTNSSWGEPTRTLVPWRPGFRHPTKEQVYGLVRPNLNGRDGANRPDPFIEGKGLGIQQGTIVHVGLPKLLGFGQTNPYTHVLLDA